MFSIVRRRGHFSCREIYLSSLALCDDLFGILLSNVKNLHQRIFMDDCQGFDPVEKPDTAQRNGSSIVPSINHLNEDNCTKPRRTQSLVQNLSKPDTEAPSDQMGQTCKAMWDSSRDIIRPRSIQQAPSTSTFPFGKLPAELQLMIIRFSMPQDGLRSIRRRNQNNEPPPSEPVRRSSIPTGLFRTNHYLSAVSLDTFHSEVCMYIGVSLRRTICCGHWLNRCPFPARIPPCNAHFFTSMRHYQLNIRYGDAILDKSLQKEMKENLRLVSDMLSENSNIKHLTVTFPCHCSWYCRCSGHCQCAMRDTSQVVAAVMDFLSPLKRIKVANTVSFKPACGPYTNAEDGICNETRCLKLAHTMEASLSQLTGEALNHREATWKRIKAMERPHYSWTPSNFDYSKSLHKFCSILEGTSDENFKFWTKRHIEALERAFTQLEIQTAADRAEWLKNLKQCYKAVDVV